MPSAATETQINNEGRAILSGGAAATRGFIVGDTTTGNRLEVLGANFTTRAFILGNAAGSSGTVQVGSGTDWSTDGAGMLSSFNVGVNGSGSLLIESGAILHSGRSRIAINAGSTGEATIRGTWIWETDQSVGLGAGTGVLNLGAGGKISLTGLTQTVSIGASSVVNIGGRTTPEAAGKLNAASVNGLGANSTLNFNHTDTNYTFATETHTPVVISGTTRLNHEAGATTLSAVNTYTGATTVGGGTLLISGTGSINGTSSVTINSGGNFSYGSSTTLNRNITINTGGTFTHNGSSAYSGVLTWNGGTLAGTNFSGVNLTVGANKTLSPGNSPGTMATSSQIWLDGGNYNLQVFDFAQASGVGFDAIAITGSLDLSGLTTGGFNINLWSLSAVEPDVNGSALNFDNTVSESWLIVSTTGGITGFDAADFAINTTAVNGTAGFSNELNGGVFTISQIGNDLYLNFSVIPEPSTWALITLGLSAIIISRRLKTGASFK